MGLGLGDEQCPKSANRGESTDATRQSVIELDAGLISIERAQH